MVIAPGLDGHLYTGTEDGGIWRIEVDGADVERIERIATVEGRPLGLDAYSEDVMVVAVALQGLVAVDTTTGDSWVLSGATEQFGPSLINGPDNLRFDDEGRLWIGGSNLRDDLVDTVLTNADLRRQLADTPVEEVRGARPPYGFAQVLSPAGEPLHSFHDETGRFFGVSGALAADGFVTFATLEDGGIARIPLPQALR